VWRLPGTVLFGGGLHLVGVVARPGGLDDVEEPVATLRDVVDQCLFVGIVGGKRHVQRVNLTRGMHVTQLSGSDGAPTLAHDGGSAAACGQPITAAEASTAAANR